MFFFVLFFEIITYLFEVKLKTRNIFVNIENHSEFIAELNLFSEVTCLIRPFFLCPNGDLLILVLLYLLFNQSFLKHHYNCLIKIYIYHSIKRSPLGQRKNGLIRQVTSEKRFNSYKKDKKKMTAWAGLTVLYMGQV
jgi:hypothetical protein